MFNLVFVRRSAVILFHSVNKRLHCRLRTVENLGWAVLSLAVLLAGKQTPDKMGWPFDLHY